jgi:hypothetical protein
MKNARSAALLCLSACLLSATAIAAPKSGDRPTPVLSFKADKTEYVAGERAQLSWASAWTRFCQAGGDWTGKLDTEGTYWTPPLDAAKSYELKCMAPGGGVSQTLSLAVVAPEPTGDPAPLPTEDPVPPPEDPVPPPEDPVPPPEDPVPPPEEPPPPEPAPAPTVVLSAADPAIAGGSSTWLSWSATDATSCEGQGWGGVLATDGSLEVGPIDSTTSYTVACSGAGGSASASVQVVVVPPPSVSLAAADPQVTAGGSTTLSWNASNASGCQATGGWTGSRGTDGSEQVTIDGSTTFTLSCSGTGGTAVQMVAVDALANVNLSWVTPQENVDGTPLTDLEKYRIYIGRETRSYDESIDVTDPGATSHTFQASSGEIFVTMTALDRDGNESAFSNEIVRIVP